MNQGVSVPKPQQKPPFCTYGPLLDRYGPSCPQKRAVLRFLSQNCSARAVFLILRLALGGEGRLGEAAGEQQPRQQEGGPQSGVEKRDEPVRGHAAGLQPDAAGHHHRHDDEGLHIEEFEEEVRLLLVGADAGCDRMLPVCADKSHRSGSFRLHNDL